jgi:hypothetical protein
LIILIFVTLIKISFPILGSIKLAVNDSIFILSFKIEPDILSISKLIFVFLLKIWIGLLNVTNKLFFIILAKVSYLFSI